MCKYLSESLPPILWATHPEVELLGHRVILFLIFFAEASSCFPCGCTISPTVHKRSKFSVSSPKPPFKGPGLLSPAAPWVASPPSVATMGLAQTVTRDLVCAPSQGLASWRLWTRLSAHWQHLTFGSLLTAQPPQPPPGLGPHQPVPGSLPDPADVVHVLQLHRRLHCKGEESRHQRPSRGTDLLSGRLLSSAQTLP